MNRAMTRRVLDNADRILKGQTIRQIAAETGVSKSTVGRDVCDRIMIISESVGNEVAEVLAKNFAEKHIKGGEATAARFRRNR